MDSLALHKTIQRKIASTIGDDRVKLEHPFPRHFADIYWPEKNLIIEIQCSPISLEEAIKRTVDYENLGLDIVWILHQKTFNKRFLGPTELFLRSRNAFFVNGAELIYDQDEIIAGHRRLYRSSPYPIDITSPEPLPLWLRFKQQLMLDALWGVGKSSIGFKGDRHKKNLKGWLRWLGIKIKVR